MQYMEYRVRPPLAPWIAGLWHVRVPQAAHQLQCLLPGGRMQIILNLARESCHGVSREGVRFRQEPALVVGVQRRWSYIDAIDMEEMMGVVFAPGGLLRFAAEPADRFTDTEISAEAVFGGAMRGLRERLQEERMLADKFAVLGEFLLQRMQGRRGIHPAVCAMLSQMQRVEEMPTVESLTRSTGLSARRLSQLFREEVGVGPKLYCRIQRFQHAMVRLHRGDEVPWPELALACGYYDQSHFANDFREFSGINPTTYLRRERPWASHLTV